MAVCAVCLEGYAAGSGYTCSKCTGARRGLAIGVGLVLLVLAAIVVAVAVSYLGSPDEESAVEEYLSRRQTQLEGSRVSQGLKIIIVSWQIVSQASTVHTAGNDSS